MTTSDFSTVPLRAALFDNLATLNYHKMTPVQALSLPAVLAGQDVIVQARTGSGKTAAFGLGVLQTLDTASFSVQSLILCPTRELADQVATECRRLARGLPNTKILTLCGGKAFGPQIGSLEHGAHIVVGTPGRIEEHLQKGSLKLHKLTTFVLDEADRMLDLGFQPALDAILEFLPAKRQNLLFSATFPERIQAIAQRIMPQPVRITVDEQHDRSSIEEQFISVKGVPRDTAVQLLLLSIRPDTALVFCNTKEETKLLARHLNRHGLNAMALHGDLEQPERDKTLIMFTNRSVSILVATDVAARGLDIEAVDLVINHQIARETAVHTHRVGRTGRAGLSGRAITLFEEKERFKLDRLAKTLDQLPEEAPLPDSGLLNSPGYRAPMVTLEIDGGRKQKLRPGDLVGALTADDGLEKDQIGKIHITELRAFLAVKRTSVDIALDVLNNRPIKGRKFRARTL